MPIEFTSDETKKSRKTEEKYLYLRYLFLAIIGSFTFLYFSFAYLGFLFPVVASAGLLVYVEYKRAHSKEEKLVETQVPQAGRKSAPIPAASSTKFERSAMLPAVREAMKPEDILMIVAPACIACAIISIAAYLAYQQQLNLHFGSTFAALLELSFAVVFGALCIGLLIYIITLLLKRHNAKRAPLTGRSSSKDLAV